jgi:hypothetical protein
VFLGWYDGDKKYPTERKLADAVDRYQEKFGRAPRYCLTSPLDALELAESASPVEVHGRSYIARWIYYVGEELPQ